MSPKRPASRGTASFRPSADLAPAAAAFCPALAELSEMAARSPRLDFRLARARAVVDALRRDALAKAPANPAGPTTTPGGRPTQPCRPSGPRRLR